MPEGNTSAAKTINERFADALSELIGMCMEAGMHTSEMIEPMERELKWLRDPFERSDETGKP